MQSHATFHHHNASGYQGTAEAHARWAWSEERNNILLVLRRKVEEEIVVGTDIHIKILAIEGGKRVRIGITAPHDMLILRAELLRGDPAAQESAAVQDGAP